MANSLEMKIARVKSTTNVAAMYRGLSKRELVRYAKLLRAQLGKNDKMSEGHQAQIFARLDYLDARTR